MLINACHLEECRVAVVAEGLLEELDIDIKYTQRSHSW